MARNGLPADFGLRRFLLPTRVIGRIHRPLPRRLSRHAGNDPLGRDTYAGVRLLAVGDSQTATGSA